MTKANDKTYRKLAWFAQEKLQDEVTTPDRKFGYEPGFGVADCVSDFHNLISFDAINEAFEWYQHLYGLWYVQNQEYTGPGRHAVVQLINERGELDLDPNLERKDTAEARLFIDKMLSGESESDPACLEKILESQEFSEARAQLQGLKAFAEMKKDQRRQNDLMATSSPLGFGLVNRAIAGNTYSISSLNEPQGAPIPKTEYFCNHCEKKLFLTINDVIRCDDCGCKVLLKPDTK